MKTELKFVVYKSGVIRKSWKWKAVAPNGKILCSAKGFNSKRLAEENIRTLRTYLLLGNAVIIDGLTNERSVI